MNITALRLRNLREKKKLSQNDVAKIIGVTRAAYNKYECGVSRPIRKLEELSALFGVTIDYILGKDETSFENEVETVSSHEHNQTRRLKLTNSVYNISKRFWCTGRTILRFFFKPKRLSRKSCDSLFGYIGYKIVKNPKFKHI